MPLVWDLVEAINIAWGVAGGEGVTSVKDLLSDRAFRKRLIADFETSSATAAHPAALRVAKSRGFLRWLSSGGTDALSDHLSDEQLQALGIVDAAAAVRAGELLRDSVRHTALRFGSWTERAALAEATEAVASLGVVQELLTAVRLQTAPRAFVSHGQYVTRLRSRRGGQAAGAHSYIPPDPHHPSHPHNLWRRLEAGEALLIKGVGGSGKTRLLVEVASHAQIQGWNVVHVVDQPPGSVDDLIAIVQASSQPSLLVMDYPNELDDIVTLTDLEERVFAETAQAGGRVAALGAARPGWLALRPPPPLGPFAVVAIDNSDAHQSHVSHAIASLVAPTASGTLTDAEFRRLTGVRPMIATLIARELEALAIAGLITEPTLPAIHSGDLSTWLRRRLEEDGYSEQRPRTLTETVEVSTAVCVASAMLLATPGPVGYARTAGESVALDAGEPNPDLFAQRTLDHLLEAGWVSLTGDLLASVHDTVVDHLIAAIVQADDHNGRTSYGDAVLTAVAVVLPALPKVVANLGRYITDAVPGVETDAATRTRYVEQWVSRVVPRLRAVVLQTALGEEAAAIEHLLTSRLIGAGEIDPLVAIWTEWMRRHGDASSALGLLRILPRVQALVGAEWVTDVTRRWLAVHASSYEAAPLVVATLRHPVTRDAPWVHDAAERWLAENASQATAGNVLNRILEVPLLRRGDVAAAAMSTWFEHHADSPLARRILVNALTGFALPGDAWVIPPLQRHLSDHAGEESISSLLARIAIHPQLRPTRWMREAAEAWLIAMGTAPGAANLLGVLVEQGALHDSPWMRPLLEDWLEKNASHFEAALMIERVVEHADGTSVEVVEPAAKAWLAVHGSSVDARRVMGRLMENSIFADEEWSHDAVRVWLEANAEALVARELLEKVIRNVTICRSEWVRDAALRWLDVHGSSDKSRPLILTIAHQRKLRTADWVEPATRSWLALHGTDMDARMVLARLLHDAGYRQEQWVVDAVQEWLTVHGTAPEAEHLLAACVFLPGFGSADWVQAAARRWLASGPHPGAEKIERAARWAGSGEDSRWSALLGWRDDG